MRIQIIAGAIGLMAIVGCAQATYQITDPSNGHVYTTHAYKRVAAENVWTGAMTGSGAVMFTDLATGDEVTIQNSSIHVVDPGGLRADPRYPSADPHPESSGNSYPTVP